MPGIKSVYNSRTADFSARYSDAHPWCRLDIWRPSGSAVGVEVNFRGGGGISQPALHSRYYEQAVEEIDKDYVDAMLTAGFAYVRVEYPNFASQAVKSRHHPFLRSPHSWRVAQRAVQFIQTNALNGKLTGSRSVTLPADYRQFLGSGTSMGAYIAAQIALSPDGMMPYEDAFKLSINDKRVHAPGRVRAAYLNDLPADFRIYADEVSGEGIQFFGVSDRFYPDVINANNAGGIDDEIVTRWNRWSNISKEEKDLISLIPTIAADSSENRHVGFFCVGSASFEESSYLASGMTIRATAYTVSGTLSGATTIVTTDVSKGGNVKLATEDDGVLLVYVEPNSATFSGFPDTTVANHWTGALTVKNIAGATVATINSGGYELRGSDARKAFITRDQAVASLLADGFAQQDELTTPHSVTHSAVVKYYRDLVFDRHGLDTLDVYMLGGHYPAQISGDTAGPAFNPSFDQAAEVLEWLENTMGFDL